MVSEYQIQSCVFAWIDRVKKSYPNIDLAYSTASGVKLPIGLLMKCKRVGIVKKGVPDVVIPVPKSVYHGLYIELKTDKGKASSEQLEYIERLNKLGYRAIVTHGLDEAIKEIRSYFVL